MDIPEIWVIIIEHLNHKDCVTLSMVNYMLLHLCSQSPRFLSNDVKVLGDLKCYSNIWIASYLGNTFQIVWYLKSIAEILNYVRTCRTQHECIMYYLPYGCDLNQTGFGIMDISGYPCRHIIHSENNIQTHTMTKIRTYVSYSPRIQIQNLIKYPDLNFINYIRHRGRNYLIYPSGVLIFEILYNPFRIVATKYI